MRTVETRSGSRLHIGTPEPPVGKFYRGLTYCGMGIGPSWSVKEETSMEAYRRLDGMLWCKLCAKNYKRDGGKEL